MQTNANNILSERGITSSNLSVHGVGGAVTAETYTDAAAKVTGADWKKNITFSYFKNDPVSTSTISGGNPGARTLEDLWQVFDTSNSMHSCYGMGATGCRQTEILSSNAPQGAVQDNSNLIQFRGGQRVDSNDNPINK